MTRNLVMAGNFNLTNNAELFEMLVDLGQHPRNRTDTVIVLEKIGHFLDEANDAIFRKYNKQKVDRKEITNHIVKDLVRNLLPGALVCLVANVTTPRKTNKFRELLLVEVGLLVLKIGVIHPAKTGQDRHDRRKGDVSDRGGRNGCDN